MRLIPKVAPDNFNLFLCGDNHEGSVMAYHTGMVRMFDMVESEFEGIAPRHNYLVHSGDHIEAFTWDDPRYHPANIKTSTPQEENDFFIENWGHLQTHWIVMMEGNHPWRLRTFDTLTENTCKKIGIEYGGFLCKIIFLNKKREPFLKTFHEHGKLMIKSIADDPHRRRNMMELILKRHLKDLAGDCQLMSKGHTHRLLVCKPQAALYMNDDEEDIVQNYTTPQFVDKIFAMRKPPERKEFPAGEYIHPDHRWYVNTGSFLKSQMVGKNPYTEMLELPPVELGFAVAMIRDRQVVDVKEVLV